MLRTAALSAVKACRSIRPASAMVARSMSHGPTESDEAFDERYVNYFNRADISHWEVRKAMNDFAGMDLLPEPKIVDAALRACRRVNEYSLAVRFLEMLKWKSQMKPDIYPYLIQEVKPTLEELGIDTPEELGYDKPELSISSVYDIH